ncbi:MAG: sulfotransferase [Hyphomonadaceae bacterium]
MTATPVLLQEAMQSMRAEPARAAALCRALLQNEPNNIDARLLLSEALRLSGDLPAAHAAIVPVAAAHPRLFGAQRQLGIILAAMRSPVPATLALRAAAEVNPGHPTIWRDLADQLALCGDAKGARAAYLRHALSPTMEPRLAGAGAALRAGEIEAAAKTLEAFLTEHPNDVNGLRMIAEAHARLGRYAESEAALRRVIALAPEFAPARHELGQMLISLGRVDDALSEARNLLQLDPRNVGSQRLLASALNARGDYGEALEIYQRLVADDPSRAATWTTIGHVLKTMGRTEAGVEAYRKSIALAPQQGDAYWGLANLKTVRLSDQDVQQLRAQLDRADLTPQDRVNMFFTLGKALEQRNDVEGAFNAYAAGAKLRGSYDRHDAGAVTAFVDACVRLQDSRFFADRAGGGETAPDPIFIIGLPRSGSTLVEQILASHSLVEGTMELLDLQNLARGLGAGLDALEALAALDAEARAALGRSYLDSTRSRRKLDRPFFIDKMPNNWMHVGLIQLVLPNAKIVDARRHPMACGWSCFRQHFPLGQAFSYDLADIGRYYADYVRLMAHYDGVLPGRVHRVIHEHLVADPETQIRALLDHCGLPFEAQCLRPHETKRPVHTASAEQVRQPISAKGLEEWRAFEPHLGELRDALGAVLDAYPAGPK